MILLLKIIGIPRVHGQYCPSPEYSPVSVPGDYGQSWRMWVVLNSMDIPRVNR